MYLCCLQDSGDAAVRRGETVRGCCRGEETERQRGQPPVTSRASARSHAGAQCTDIAGDKVFVLVFVNFDFFCLLMKF